MTRCPPRSCGPPALAARFSVLSLARKLALVAILICAAGSSCATADDDAGKWLVQAAREQIGKTVHYDPAYRSIPYPGGDVPMESGVCSDVVVRAFRAGLGVDLQKSVHEDMKRDFKNYRNNSGLKSPDKNIDHRRVVNLQTYFKRMGYSMAVSRDTGDYKPGDLVTCTVPPNLPHIMIVSDGKELISGRPLVIHNTGAGTREEDRLFAFALTGHYRVRHVERVTSPPQRVADGILPDDGSQQAPCSTVPRAAMTGNR
jgi:uncharacterized protein